jgi:hypothetical protein
MHGQTGHPRHRRPSIKAEDLDRKFDAGEDVTEHLNIARARRPNAKPQSDRSKPDDDSGANREE